MPEICRFFGIIIQMYRDDHSPPHIHVRYNEHRGKFDIEMAASIGRKLPRRVHLLVVEWILLNQDSLKALWQIAQDPDKSIGVATMIDIDIINVEYVEGYRLNLQFENEEWRTFDFKERIQSSNGQMIVPLKDVEFFKRVTVDPELGTIVWPNGFDQAPDVLYEKSTPLSREAA
jgi:hypothetical protein